jgi:Ca-activated chloride channel family protein
MSAPAGNPLFDRAAEICLPGVLCFADRIWLFVALGVGLLLALVFALDFTRRRRLLDKIGHAPQLRRMGGSLSGGRRIFKAVLVVAALVCIALAMAHPQIEGESMWRQRGIDLVVVMDFSKSMMALDTRPSRLGRARVEVDQLIDGLEGDRVGVVSFAGDAVHYPLTTDYDAAKILYHGISPLDMAPGSDVATALTVARCLLRPDLDGDAECATAGRRGRGHGGDPLDENEARRRQQRGLLETELGERARAIVLVTDGEQTEGDAIAAARKANEAGIAVYVVGVGTPQGAPIPEYDRDGNQRGYKEEDGKTVTSRLDEAGLKELARAAGGEDHYYRLHAGRMGMEPIVNALRRLKEGDLESRVERRPQEAYQYLLFPAFLALVGEALLADRRRRPRKESKP